jgi:phage/plasmid primase-like uncharacterized protein
MNNYHVAKEINDAYPGIKKVFVADNDNKTPDHGNTGVYECARAVNAFGGHVFVPVVKDGTDVCDLYNESGLKELKRQIYESDEQYFNGRFSQNVAGLFNYIHDRYLPSSTSA